MMKSGATQIGRRIATFLPVFLWAIWIGAFAWLIDGGRYRAFLQPRFWPLPVIALAVLTLFFIAFWYRYPGTAEPRNTLGHWLRIGVLLIPVIYLYAGYGQSLGANALANRTAGGAAVFSLEEFGRRMPQPEYTPGKEVLLSTLTMKPEVFVEKTITVIGCVYRDQNVPDAYFLMFRFFIFCCAADAVPLWVVVASEQSPALTTETWVKVTGRFRFESIHNNTVPMLLADSVEAIPAPPPELRYLYF